MQILMFDGDNATSTNKQTIHLDKVPNAFEEVNCICCFNHTMQLSAKALMKPFDTPTTSANSDGNEPPDTNNIDVLLGEVDNDDNTDEEDGEGDIDSD